METTNTITNQENNSTKVVEESPLFKMSKDTYNLFDCFTESKMINLLYDGLTYTSIHSKPLSKKEKLDLFYFYELLTKMIETERFRYNDVKTVLTKQAA